MRLKIGEFARLGQVSVQTLRYYDSLGLLRPGDVDPMTNYRYYALDQLPDLMRILALKDLGFSLEQIAQFLSMPLSSTDLRKMLTLKQQELRNQVQEQLDRLERLEARLRLMDQDENALKLEVIVKRIDSLEVASVRGVIPSYWDVSPLWTQLFEALGRLRLSPCAPTLTLFHASEPEIDVQVCAPLPADANTHGSLKVETLPAYEMAACTIHQGPFSGLAAAYAALVKWVDANGYSIAGPDREVYLRLPEDCQYATDPNAITELQIPICHADP